MKFADVRSPRTLSMTLFALLCVATALAFAHAASPDDAPPPPPPPGPPHLEQTIRDLDLTNDQSQKLAALLDTMHQQETKARDEFLKNAQDVLTPAQLEKLHAAMNQHPPRPSHDHDQPTTGPSGNMDPQTAPPLLHI